MEGVRAENLDRARVWLESLENGLVTRADLCRMAGFSERHLRRHLALARALREEEEARPDVPRLNILLPRTPCVAFKHANCADVHPKGPIPQGSHDYCSVGGESGLDYLFVGVRRPTIDRTNRKYDPDPHLKGGL